MTLLWLGARGARVDAETERDAVTAERDAANDESISADARLQTALDDLAEARADLNAASGGAVATGQSDEEELDALSDRVDELTAEVERLEDENAALVSDLETAAAPTTSVPAPGIEDTEPVTTTTVPEDSDLDAESVEEPAASPDEVGDQISGLFRNSVLGAGQQQCLGQSVLEELGDERTIDAIASETPGDDEEFVDAVAAAADACNIDPSAVFG